VKIVAGDLVRLYAARQLLQGHAFGADGEWQRELEASFPFEETPDQIEAIAAVKADMESDRPMDRVICGDVGFGKTEVAVRAAFKAVQDGFQVAILVPTTVLAEQHLRTFSERLAGFPMRIEVLSRFRSDAEARDVIRRAASGEIDILIGTHRLLEANVEFQNLGLVVIDEEQRFGVTHKERLKRMRLEVDVLTLSATPIPRTLHMALTGIRDMSTIDTPPEGRRPVQTYVMEWDLPAVREAILHELERGGQVYLVHNRVRSIDQFSDELKKLVPQARIVVGHGQMPENLLKRVMERFADGEFDVLVCTTIIESGIDIPNVNTLIVDRADRLGLAQMYQLRGRVGRGANQAYAYLFHPKDGVLREVAQQRLSTIFEASELGAGFQVALRDLEIRGAGNLLGAEQSGHIASVGFDLYTQMLGEAVEELRAAHEHRAPEPLPHERRNALRSTQIDLPVPAYIPESYIEDIEARLALYQRIASIGGQEDIGAIERETADRFGELPPALMSLFDLVRLRLTALSAGVASVRLGEGDVIVTAAEGQPFSGRAVPRLPSGVRIGRNQLRLPAGELGEDLVEPIEALLQLLSGEREAVPA
jgi:transcription-repair coupling factor (superfamily II helicase)